MAIILFTKAALESKNICCVILPNIDDITEGVVRVTDNPAKLMDCIKAIEIT